MTDQPPPGRDDLADRDAAHERARQLAEQHQRDELVAMGPEDPPGSGAHRAGDPDEPQQMTQSMDPTWRAGASAEEAGGEPGGAGRSDEASRLLREREGTPGD